MALVSNFHHCYVFDDSLAGLVSGLSLCFSWWLVFNVECWRILAGAIEACFLLSEDVYKCHKADLFCRNMFANGAETCLLSQGGVRFCCAAG